jgi:hypothetical protein
MEAEADLYDNAMNICMLTIATRKVLHDFSIHYFLCSLLVPAVLHQFCRVALVISDLEIN